MRVCFLCARHGHITQVVTTRWPAMVLAVMVAATVALGALASTVEMEVDLTQFGREDSLTVQAMDRVRNEFGDPTAMIQVILDAGEGGDVLSVVGLKAVAEAEALVIDALVRA